MVAVSAKTQTNLDSAARDDSAGGRSAGSEGQSEPAAMGTVLEAKLDRGRGPVATVLVRNGTLHVGDYLHLRRRLRQGARHAERSRRAGPQSRALHPGGSAGSRIAARGRRQFPGGHGHRQGQADRRLPRPEGARSRAGQIQPPHAGATAQADARRARSRNCRSSSRPTWAAPPKCSTETLQKLSNDKVKIRVHPLRRRRHHRIATCCWPRLRTPSSSGSTCGRSATPRRWPSRRRWTSACTRSFTT